jgi:hypothetical protein
MVYLHSEVTNQAMKRHGGILSAHCLVKQGTLKGYMLYDSNYLTFWKGQNKGDNIKISGYLGHVIEKEECIG